MISKAPSYERPRNGTPPPKKRKEEPETPKKRRRKTRTAPVKDKDADQKGHHRPPLPRKRRFEPSVSIWTKEKSEPSFSSISLGAGGRPPLPRKRVIQGGMREQDAPLDIMKLAHYLQLKPVNDKIRDLFPWLSIRPMHEFWLRKPRQLCL